jgi:hypothetical protein
LIILTLFGNLTGRVWSNSSETGQLDWPHGRELVIPKQVKAQWRIPTT